MVDLLVDRVGQLWFASVSLYRATASSSFDLNLISLLQMKVEEFVVRDRSPRLEDFLPR